MTQRLPEQSLPRSLGLRRMQPRDSHEPNRTSSPLELFFDLVFVIAVSVSSAQLHEVESGEHFSGLWAYLLVFFAIWWAWMNFTWFATSFAVDDWLYRLMTFVQMAGILILAAGVEEIMVEGELGISVLGYIIMRIALVGQWLRAAWSSPANRRAALTYAGGIVCVQILWAVLVYLPEDVNILVIPVLIVAEISVPILAEWRRNLPWHPHHIAERFGLFTIILLGESLLASAQAIFDALAAGDEAIGLIELGTVAFGVTCGLWWIYFSRPAHGMIGKSLRHSLTFGYSHYFIFAAAGAFSAGIEVAIDNVTDETTLEAAAAAATTTVPVAVFILGVWVILIRPTLPLWANVALPLLAVLTGLSAFGPYSLPVALTLVVLAVVVVHVTRRSGENEGSEEEGATAGSSGG